jgi:hypothetical protein
MNDDLRDYVEDHAAEPCGEEEEERDVERAGVWAEIGALFEDPLYPLRALLTGSVALTQRLATPGRWVLDRAKATVKWVLAGEDGEERLSRCGVIAGCCWSVYLAVRHIWPELLAAGGVLWVVVSWAVAPTPSPENQPAEETPADADHPDDEAELQPTPRAAGEDLTRSLLKAVDVHTSGGTRGVHLETLAAHLQLSVSALRDHCRRAGIPVRDQLKVRGRNRTGIHRGDVEELLGTPLHHQAADLTPAHSRGVIYPEDHSPGSPF